MNMLLNSVLGVIFMELLTSALCSHGDTRKNVILIITDDQDIELGSMSFMPKVLRLMKEKGTEFKGGFVSTPICCPSRSSLLTGMYVHNHNVHTNNHNCSGEEWRKVHEHRSIGTYMQEAGYRTAYLGKYLNEYEGDYVPPGWEYWLGLVKNSKFYNYTINFNGDRVKYGSDYVKDYFTDLITNHSIKFIEDHFLNHNNVPFLLVVSYPAPHGPEDPAPQYADLFEDIDSHRTESWNYAPNPDKQWLLQRTGKMEPVHVAFTDLLHRRRMQTLQSVDDGVHQIFTILRDYNYLSSTYAFYTSDHGYHLGQFGLIKGKNMPYEFDIRVPFFLRGPGVMKNFSIREPVMNVDIAPTMLSIAGAEIPAHMDGRNLLDLVAIKKAAVQGKSEKTKLIQPWRDTILIERGKMPKLRKIRDRWLNQKEHYGKEMRLNEACSKPEWQRPCAGTQQWSCYRSNDNRWRILKCRDRRGRHCPPCPSEKRHKRSADDSEENEAELIDEFLKTVHEYNIIRGRQWHQGHFDSPYTRRRRNACSCRGNIPHPLKLDELGIKSSDSTDAHRKKKEKGTANSDRAACSVQQMNCFLHNTEHWKTPPLWPDQYGQFCFCQNSNNNTYWCLRTINEVENFLYCEFVTEFVSFYDLNEDPYQLHNVVYSLDMDVLEKLSERLRYLRECKGATCELYSNPIWEEHVAETSKAPKGENEES